MDTTQLSIIQPRFMPLFGSLQSQSKLLSIIQPHFMPLIGSLQRESTQLSIIHTCFMLIPFTLRESLTYPPMGIWVSTLFIKIFSNSTLTSSLINTLQSQSKLLSIIHTRFMPLLITLQRESTQLSIIHS